MYWMSDSEVTASDMSASPPSASLVVALESLAAGAAAAKTACLTATGAALVAEEELVEPVSAVTELALAVVDVVLAWEVVEALESVVVAVGVVVALALALVP